MVAGRVREAIARPRHRLDRLGIERAVGIREVIDRHPEALLEHLTRADGFLEHPRRALTREERVGPRVRAHGDAAALHLGEHRPGQRLEAVEPVGVDRQPLLERREHPGELLLAEGREEEAQGAERLAERARRQGPLRRHHAELDQHLARGRPVAGEQEVEAIVVERRRAIDPVRHDEDGGGDPLALEDGIRVLVHVAIAVIERDGGGGRPERPARLELRAQLVERDEPEAPAHPVELALEHPAAHEHRRDDRRSARTAVVDDTVIADDQRQPARARHELDEPIGAGRPQHERQSRLEIGAPHPGHRAPIPSPTAMRCATASGSTRRAVRRAARFASIARR